MTLQLPLPAPPSLASRRRRVPYRELDPGIVPLVRAINRLPHLVTISSCSGHRTKRRDEYYVLVALTRMPEALTSIAFLAWAVGEFTYSRRRPFDVAVEVHGGGGQPSRFADASMGLQFVVRGRGRPRLLARWIDAARRQWTV